MDGLRFLVLVFSAAILLSAAANAQETEESSKEVPSDEEDADYELTTSENCNQRFNLTESDYEGELSPEAKCYLNCIAEKNDLITDGNVDREAFSEVLSYYFSVLLDSDNEDMVYIETTACLNENIDEGYDKCDVAYTLYQCILQSLTKAEPREFWTSAMVYSKK